MNERSDLADRAARDRIERDLDTTLLVEAAAGTGKTTSMVRRMVALLETGRCAGIEHVAAVTFTRKAAAEMRARFQAALEQRAKVAQGQARRRVADALAGIERCFVGTIHSFCGRLLRERPVEAGTDVSFREMDEAEDALWRDRAWEQYVASLYAGDDPLLDELNDLGLAVGELRSAFDDYARYPDVAEWPTPAPSALDLDAVRAALMDYVRHIETIPFPPDTGSDELMPHYRLIARLARYGGLSRPAELMALLEECGPKKTTQMYWAGRDGKARAKAEKARWDAFLNDTVAPALQAWRARRYATVLRVLEGARAVYDRLREEAGALNFQDLLLRAAALLRENVPHVRRYFAERFTHLLVDEFQDTDPIQAEVMLLLTADDPSERDWRSCRPRPGALFVVGDPKQSIYRFRRADIVTYAQVRELIVRSGGEVVRLTTNFRSIAPLCEWVNAAFGGAFPAAPDAYSPEYVPLTGGRVGTEKSPEPPVMRLCAPPSLTNQEAIADHESETIARWIRHALDEGWPLPRTEEERAAGLEARVRPGDFLILTRKKHRLYHYAQALQRWGVPHQVAGGSALNRTPELGLLRLALRVALRPDDPVALVAALRSELFGVSDPALYAYRRAGGRFRLAEPIPADLPAEYKPAFEDAVGRLRRYRTWLENAPPMAAVERIVEDLGLAARAAAAPGGSVQAGGLCRALELLRAAQEPQWTAADLVAFLDTVASGEEGYDSMPVLPPPEAPVRLMNLHKAKGLQAAVVFLADPSGESDHPVRLHVDRTGPVGRGYMAVYGRREENRPARLLACPTGWAQFEEEERRFEEAEERRLLYVAATRAGARLVISQRAKRKESNPWCFFEPALRAAPELEAPALAAPQDGLPAGEVSPAEATAAREERGRRWHALLAPTYRVEQAKAVSLRPSVLSAGGEHGTEFGEAVHAVLEERIRRPDADLRDLALSALRQSELEYPLLEAVLEAVNAVAASEVWSRARGSTRCLAEVPFVEFDPGGRPPRLLRGVIDLAFWEHDGWVIVDYKTGGDATTIGRLAAHYLPQVRTYAQAWERCTGEPVKEVGIFFTRAARYVADPSNG